MVLLAGESITFGERPDTESPAVAAPARRRRRSRAPGLALREMELRLNDSALLAATIERAAASRRPPRRPAFVSIPTEFLMDCIGEAARSSAPCAIRG